MPSDDSKEWTKRFDEIYIDEVSKYQEQNKQIKEAQDKAKSAREKSPHLNHLTNEQIEKAYGGIKTDKEIRERAEEKASKRVKQEMALDRINKEAKRDRSNEKKPSEIMRDKRTRGKEKSKDR